MAEQPRSPDPKSADQKPKVDDRSEPKRPAQGAPDPAERQKTREDMLEEDRFESTDN